MQIKSSASVVLYFPEEKDMKTFESNAQRFETVCFSIFNVLYMLLFSNKDRHDKMHRMPPESTHALIHTSTRPLPASVWRGECNTFRQVHASSLASSCHHDQAINPFANCLCFPEAPCGG